MKTKEKRKKPKGRNKLGMLTTYMECSRKKRL